MKAEVNMNSCLKLQPLLSLSIGLIMFFFLQHIDAMELLIHSYPKFVSVARLPCETMEAKVLHAFVFYSRTLALNDLFKLIL